MFRQCVVIGFLLHTLVLFPVLCIGDALLLRSDIFSSGMEGDTGSNGQFEALAGRDIAGVRYASNDLVTVKLNDGAVYYNSKINVDWNYMVLVVQSGNRRPKNLQFDSIESIIDSQGRDITGDVLREYAGTSHQNERVVGGRPVGDSYGNYSYSPRRLPWRFGITVSPTYSYPFGQWYEGIEPDVGVRAIASIGLSSEVALDIGYQYQPLGINDKYVSDVSDVLGGGVGVDIREFDIHVEKIFVGPRYLGKARTAPLWGYGSFGLGGYIHKSHIVMAISDPYFGGIVMDEEVSEVEFAMTYAGGLVYMFSSNVGIDLGGRFDMVFGTVEGIPNISSGYLAEFSGGLVLAF